MTTASSMHLLGSPVSFAPRRPVAVDRTPVVTPFMRSLELIAAARVEAQRKRPALDNAAPFVRFAVLNMMRCR